MPFDDAVLKVVGFVLTDTLYAIDDIVAGSCRTSSQLRYTYELDAERELFAGFVFQQLFIGAAQPEINWHAPPFHPSHPLFISLPLSPSLPSCHHLPLPHFPNTVPLTSYPDPTSPHPPLIFSSFPSPPLKSSYSYRSGSTAVSSPSGLLSRPGRERNSGIFVCWCSFHAALPSFNTGLPLNSVYLCTSFTSTRHHPISKTLSLRQHQSVLVDGFGPPAVPATSSHG